MIATNLSGAFYCSARRYRAFSADRGGSIINISSLAGKNPFAGGVGLQRFEVRTERFQRSDDAGPPERQCTGELRHAGQRRYRICRSQTRKRNRIGRSPLKTSPRSSSTSSDARTDTN